MPRKTAAPDPPASTPDVQVALGHPILPAGLTLTVTVPMTYMEGTIATLLEWIATHEKTWSKLPTVGPDLVPGGTPASDADLFYEARRRQRVGY